MESVHGQGKAALEWLIQAVAIKRNPRFPPLEYTQSDLIGQDLSVVVKAAFEEESRPVQG